MSRDEKIREAQEVLDWTIMHLEVNLKCKTIDYKHNNFRVHIFTKEDKLIMPILIPEEWVKESNPKENVIHDKLGLLLKNLENYK